MNRELIGSMSRYIADRLNTEFSKGALIQNFAIEWFERNPQEPVGVELTDNQLCGIFDRFPYKATFDEFVEGYHEWAKTQNLVKPEVKEITVGLSDEQINDLAVCMRWEVGCREGIAFLSWLKTQTFAQSQLFEPVVLGLSDEQVDDILNLFSYDSDEYLEYAKKLGDYLKTQTFTRPQYFYPSWDIIPSHVDEVEIVMNYCQDGMILDDESNFLISYKRPKPPAPKVEVGQVWKYKGNHYTVGLLSTLKVINTTEWVSCVNYISDNSGNCYTRTLEDFLAKFEQVQS